MRDKKRPDKPLYTIQIDPKTMKLGQTSGYANRKLPDDATRELYSLLYEN